MTPRRRLPMRGEVHALEESLEPGVGAELFQTWVSVYVGASREPISRAMCAHHIREAHRFMEGNRTPANDKP